MAHHLEFYVFTLQDGVNWLWFLNKYKLHGILCDDMGLGKTLQSICILVGDHFNRLEAYKVSTKKLRRVHEVFTGRVVFLGLTLGRAHWQAEWSV